MWQPDRVRYLGADSATDRFRPRRPTLAMRTVAVTLGLVSVAGACSGAQPASSAAQSSPAQSSPAQSSPAQSSPALTSAPEATGLTPATGAAARSIAAQPCGRTRTPRRWDHIIWIWFENHSLNQTIGATGSRSQRTMPYYNFLARGCGLATNYHAITHPSLPNYINAVSGASTATSNCAPKSCSQRQASLFSVMNRLRKSWRAYSESMPSLCSKTDKGLYRVKHNPAAYFTNLGISCRRYNQPLGSPARGNFSAALAGNRVAQFNFVLPNMCNSTHDCSLTTADNWLRAWMPRILNSRAYRSGRTAVFISWDEGAGGRSRMACAASQDNSCRIANVVVSPSTRRGARSAVSYSHWSLLRTTEEMLGIRPLLGRAARAYSMRRPFGL